MISVITKPFNLFLRWQFGDFSKDELRRFSLLGGIFAFVIGVYWTLRTLKDVIFTSMVFSDPTATAQYIPYAKVVSLVILLPIIILYTKLLDKFPKEKMFYALGFIYIATTILFAILFMSPTIGFANTAGSPYRIVGWAWYVFVESFGSIMVALFWAFASDISSPEAAKKGFGYVVMIGQLGSMIGPKFIVPLGKVFGSNIPVIFICSGGILFVVLGVYYFMNTIPADQLKSYRGSNEKEVEAKEDHEPGFLEGLRLMISEKYLLGIFAIVAIYEILATIMDFNFKALVLSQHAGQLAQAAYLGEYSFTVNLVAFISLILGISNVQRYLGVTASLVLMPIIIGLMMGSFLFFGNLTVMFWLMVGVKAINYALNSPVMKQLYIPTTEDTKYKAQAWIETFGSRLSKASGSIINMVKPHLGALFIPAMSIISFGFVGSWVLIALYLGKTHKTAIQNKKVVC